MKKLFTSSLALTLFVVLFSACNRGNYYASQSYYGGYGEKIKSEVKTTLPTEQLVSQKLVEKNTFDATQLASKDLALANNEKALSRNIVVKTALKRLNTLSSAKIEIKETQKATLSAKLAKKVMKPLASKPASGEKSQLVALLLAFLVGVLGIHRFYLGYTTAGIIQLLTAGGCGVWALIDLVRIAMGDLKPKGGNYDKTL